MTDKTVIIGGGGQCKVVLDILLNNGYDVVSITDSDSSKHNTKIFNVPITGSHATLDKLRSEGVNNAIIAIGGNTARKKYYTELERLGFNMVNAIHPSAIISNRVKSIGKGIFVGMLCNIGPDCEIGNNVLINNSVSLSHSNVIEDHVNISPGSHIGGGTRIKTGAFIGLGARVVNAITIGERAIVGAGAVVLEDVPDNAIVVGVPAKVIKYRDDKYDALY